MVSDTIAKSTVKVKVPSSVKQHFFFQVCETTPCPTFTHKVQGKDVDYYKLTSANDLAALNPFSVVRALHCTKLASGVPFSCVDSAGDRQCFCACDASSTRVDTGTGTNRVNKCVENDARGTCNWNPTNALGFTKIMATVATDKSYTAPADAVLSVLYPVDNYVDYGRTSDQDTADGKNAAGAGRTSRSRSRWEHCDQELCVEGVSGESEREDQVVELDTLRDIHSQGDTEY